MLIPYTAFYSLAERKLVPRSLQGIKDQYAVSYEDSLEKAHEIEDYRYLRVMVNQADYVEGKYAFFWDHMTMIPTVLERNVDLTIDALAGFAFNNSHLYQKEEIISFIRDIANDRLKIDPEPHLQRFQEIYTARSVEYRLCYEKIGVNDPCPCESGKKYKKCHGQ